MDPELAARLDRIEARFERIDARFARVDARFDEERALVAGHFEAMQKAADRHHQDLLEAFKVRFEGLDRRLTRAEGAG